jgi:Protein of unknown function (DUF3631)
MIWPPEALWSRIAALWMHAHGAPDANAGERAKALAALKQLQTDFDLSDAQVAYVAEYQALDPSSRIIKRERPVNTFETVLGAIDGVKLIMPFEHLVIDTAWILHSYICRQFLHTPRLMIHSRGSGFGKTVRLGVINKLAFQCQYMVAPTPAVLYHHLRKHPLSTLAIDDAERMDWGRQSLLVQFIDAGHRQGAPIPRVFRDDVIWYPTFAPLTLGLILDRYLREKFLSQVTQVLTRSIICEMKQKHEGRDDILPDDPRFAPVRVVCAGWSESFKRPETPIILPPGFVGRRESNYSPLAAVADSLGYGATLRAAAVAIEAANFDPEIQLYQDIYLVFERRRVDRFWASDLVQALKEINDVWASLTNTQLYGLLWKKGIEYRTVWIDGADGERRSNKGFLRQQFEPMWRELGLLGHVGAQSKKIIHLPRHKSGTGGTHGE